MGLVQWLRGRAGRGQVTATDVLAWAIGALACGQVVASWVLIAQRGRLREAGGERLSAADALFLGVLLAALLPAQILVLSPFGLGAFGVVRIVYLQCVVVLPLSGLGLLVWHLDRTRKGHRGATAPVRALAAMLLLGFAAGAHASWLEPRRLQVERAEVVLPGPRAGEGGFRIGVLADVQTDRVTDYERAAVARLMAERPDLILIPGDLWQMEPERFAQQRPALVDLYSRLSAPAGVFAVQGDMEVPGDLARLCRDAGIRLLDNEVVPLTVGGRTVTLAGLSTRRRYREAMELARELEALERPDDVRILLAHHPDPVLGLRPDTRIDLLVAGHTHGGQVTVPGFGPPITLSRVPREVAAGGLHELAGRRVYVSRGVGVEQGQAPRIRFLCPPEISLIELR